MSSRFPLLLPSFLLCSLCATVPGLAQQVEHQIEQPCDRSVLREGQIATDESTVNHLSELLLASYQTGDKKQEEEVSKQLEGYTNHHETSFSKEEKDRMEEIAQRPEVKALIEARFAEERAVETEHSYQFNVHPCAFYPNPQLQDYVNNLGQRLVPEGSLQLYAFRIIYDPRPNAWSYSTGSVYVTTGLLSMLDNEAQLAFVLAHEVGHVEHRHIYQQGRGRLLEVLLEADKERAARKKGLIIGGIAAATGAALGGIKGGGSGAMTGAVLGFGGVALTTSIVAALHVPKYTDYPNSQEIDADEFASHAVLEHNYDIREAPKVFVAISGTIHRDDRVGGLGFSYGRASTLSERREHVQTLLTGALKTDLDLRSKAGLQATSPGWSLMISEVKRDNGVLALQYDLFDEARQNLEEAVAVRSNDPRAHFYLGSVYKLTARTTADDQRAMDHFLQAIRLDTGRTVYYQPHLERALSLLKQNDPSAFAEIQKEIKAYIELYKLNSGGSLPPGMYVLYDYLSLTGDNTWAEPPVVNVKDAKPPLAQPVAAAGNSRTPSTLQSIDRKPK